MKAKFCIVVRRKAADTVEVYNNLKSFTDKNKEYNYDKISHSLSRKKEPFADEDLTIERQEVIL